MVLLFLGHSEPSATAPNRLLGNVIGVLSGCSWSLTLLGLRWLEKRDPAAMAGGAGNAAVVGNLVTFAVCVPLALPLAGVSTADVVGVAYLGVFQVGLAYVLLTRSITHVPAVDASLLLLVEPAVSPVWAWWMHWRDAGPVAAGRRRDHHRRRGMEGAPGMAHGLSAGILDPQPYRREAAGSSGSVTPLLPAALETGRDDWIRTSDPLNPIQVRYQAALHPDDQLNRPALRPGLLLLRTPLHRNRRRHRRAVACLRTRAAPAAPRAATRPPSSAVRRRACRAARGARS